MLVSGISFRSPVVKADIQYNIPKNIQRVTSDIGIYVSYTSSSISARISGYYAPDKTTSTGRYDHHGKISSDGPGNRTTYLPLLEVTIFSRPKQPWWTKINPGYPIVYQPVPNILPECNIKPASRNASNIFLPPSIQERHSITEHRKSPGSGYIKPSVDSLAHASMYQFT